MIHTTTELALFNFYVSPPQDHLDIALVQAKQRIEEGNRDLINLERKFLVSLGKRLGDLEREQSNLQKELILKQHNITVFPKLNHELWTVHLEATRVSMGSLAALIADFVKSFKDFQTSFPAEAISQVQNNAVPNLEWLTTIQAFFNKRPAQYPLSKPLKPETTQSSLAPQLGSIEQPQLMCVGRMESPFLSPYLQELHDLEKLVAKTKEDLAVLEKEEQEIKRQQVKVIESWNKDFAPYLDIARVFQEKLATFLQQQNVSLKQHAKEPLQFINALWGFNPQQVKRTFSKVLVGNTEILKKMDMTPQLQAQINLIISLIEKMLFKNPLARSP